MPRKDTPNQSFAEHRGINILKYRRKFPNLPQNISGIYCRQLAELE
jgi:hypothetical protein